MSRPDDDPVAAALRERLRAAEEEIGLPHGLWERVRSPASAPRRADRLPHPVLAAVLAAASVAAVALGAWWPTSSGAGRPAPELAPPADSAGTAISVYHAVRGCRGPRTTECALRLAVDPYARYAAQGNRVTPVWHDDRLTARCAIDDGTRTEDESGISSTRWYLVRTPQGRHGWLPGVRTRDAPDVPECLTD
ncbi:hypothetical protein ACFVWZ_00560 [Streptomyces sp. NPDC058200]|uniref:hypothetical protein n=1 Tax=unclassified Streptomyces TaxID=2593676 RepID=UPI0036F14605